MLKTCFTHRLYRNKNIHILNYFSGLSFEGYNYWNPIKTSMLPVVSCHEVCISLLSLVLWWSFLQMFVLCPSLFLVFDQFPLTKSPKTSSSGGLARDKWNRTGAVSHLSCSSSTWRCRTSSPLPRCSSCSVLLCRTRPCVHSEPRPRLLSHTPGWTRRESPPSPNEHTGAPRSDLKHTRLLLW